MGRTRHSNTVYSFRQAEADFTMWGSGSRFSKNYGPIVEDQKSNPMYITKNCVQNYVSIVVSTVQENSSQSSSFINPQYLSLDFVGEDRIEVPLPHFTNITKTLPTTSSNLSPKGVHLTVTNWHVYKDELKIRPSMRIYIFEV